MFASRGAVKKAAPLAHVVAVVREGTPRNMKRRGSESQLPPDPMGAALTARVAQQESNARVLEEEQAAQLALSARLRAAGVAASAKLRDAAAAEPHAPLADAFVALSDALAGIEEAREQLLRRRAQEKVLLPLRVMREQLIAPMRKLLGDRKARLKAMVAADADFSAAAAAGQQLQQQLLQQLGAGGGAAAAAAAVPTTKDRRRKNSLFEKKPSSAPAGDPAAAARAGATKASEKFRRLLDEQEAARNVGSLLRAKAPAFEAARVAATRALLAEAVRARMAFHCRALELLTPAAAALERSSGCAGGAANEQGEAEAVAALEKQLASLSEW